MVGLRSTGLSECGLTESSAPEPCYSHMYQTLPYESEKKTLASAYAKLQREKLRMFEKIAETKKIDKKKFY